MFYKVFRWPTTKGADQFCMLREEDMYVSYVCTFERKLCFLVLHFTVIGFAWTQIPSCCGRLSFSHFYCKLVPLSYCLCFCCMGLATTQSFYASLFGWWSIINALSNKNRQSWQGVGGIYWDTAHLYVEWPSTTVSVNWVKRLRVLRERERLAEASMDLKNLLPEKWVLSFFSGVRLEQHFFVVEKKVRQWVYAPPKLG